MLVSFFTGVFACLASKQIELITVIIAVILTVVFQYGSFGLCLFL